MPAGLWHRLLLVQGIGPHTFDRIRARYRTEHELLQASEDDLEELLGRMRAHRVHTWLRGIAAAMEEQC